MIGRMRPLPNHLNSESAGMPGFPILPRLAHYAWSRTSQSSSFYSLKLAAAAMRLIPIRFKSMFDGLPKSAKEPAAASPILAPSPSDKSIPGPSTVHPAASADPISPSSSLTQSRTPHHRRRASSSVVVIVPVAPGYCF
ncbi:hypothetical protein Hypma_006887 [Hypsizygus marmoreus]|uniref:Uncharacterized protein n=1 Tax=Hypsizygus marmoreus TaxID=39966 RepID=A0A369JYK0_HYPMA|nr:hypothetical protein Hypma_006887 [Hypsizygus marmoreus]